MTGIEVSPPTLLWAQRRSGKAEHVTRKKLPKWDRWVTQDLMPSLNDLQKIAEHTRVPIGYLFLTHPPEEQVPIPDFRIGRQTPVETSRELIDTIHLNQRRQAWYQDYLVSLGEAEPLSFVGSARNMTVVEAATTMTQHLDYSVERRIGVLAEIDARVYLAEAFEKLGGLVVLNSMVANNTTRMLDLDEFRGFTLHSTAAPLVFVNANDTKNGQAFSLLHEFAHVWRGETGVSQGGIPWGQDLSDVESWCDAVAAEIAVPTNDLNQQFRKKAALTEELARLAGRYRCSTLVILIKLRDTELISVSNFDAVYRAELQRLLAATKATKKRSSGGDFYNNQPFRIGRTLSQAVIRDTRMGNTPMTEALRLLAFKKIAMFDRYAEKLTAN